MSTRFVLVSYVHSMFLLQLGYLRSLCFDHRSVTVSLFTFLRRHSPSADVVLVQDLVCSDTRCCIVQVDTVYIDWDVCRDVCTEKRIRLVKTCAGARLTWPDQVSTCPSIVVMAVACGDLMHAVCIHGWCAGSRLAYLLASRRLALTWKASLAWFGSQVLRIGDFGLRR